jgi:hypothetical protein
MSFFLREESKLGNFKRSNMFSIQKASNSSKLNSVLIVLAGGFERSRPAGLAVLSKKLGSP